MRQPTAPRGTRPTDAKAKGARRFQGHPQRESADCDPGSVSLTRGLQHERRYRVAVHESGHAAFACLSDRASLVCMTLECGTPDWLGCTRLTLRLRRATKAERLWRAAFHYSGRAAEQLVLSSVSAGCSRDMVQATHVLIGMMADTGPLDGSGLVRLSAEERARSIGADPAAVKELETVSLRAYELALGLLRQHRAVVIDLAAALHERGTLGNEAIHAIVERGRHAPRHTMRPWQGKSVPRALPLSANLL